MVSCEEVVDPIQDSDRQFTLWGTLDMNADLQVVRVIPIREQLAPTGDLITDLEVRSIDLDTDEEMVWRDSLVTFFNGRKGHVYLAEFRVRPGHTYRMEVSSPSLPYVTSAQTTAPNLPEVTVFPEEIRSSTSTSGAVVRGTQRITWAGLTRRPFLIEPWYRFLEFGDLDFIDYPLELETHAWTYGDGLLDVTLNLKRQFDSLAVHLPIAQLRLAGLGLTITVLDAAFEPPGGRFDPEVLVQPGTMSNVEHGFGFLGSVGRFSMEWVLANESARKLGYKNVPDDPVTIEAAPLAVRIARLAEMPEPERGARSW